MTATVEITTPTGIIRPQAVVVIDSATGEADDGRVRKLTLGANIAIVGPGPWLRAPSGLKTYRVSGTANAPGGQAIVRIEGSDTNTSISNADVLAEKTITLGPTEAGDSIAHAGNYEYLRYNVIAITGPSAQVTTTASY